MSSLITSNISDGTTSVPTGYVVNGSAKAWVNFNGTGTVAARDSFNMSSLTDNGTGDYTISLSNNMGNGDYAFAGSACTTSPQGTIIWCMANQVSDFTTSSIRVAVGYTNASANARLDYEGPCVSIHGDLA